VNKLLHIIATPRGGESRTLKVSNVFLEEFRKRYPACRIDELNVSTETLPPLTVKVVSGKYELLGGKDLSGELKEAWKDVERQIERFLAADSYLISTPMWNFNIPYSLKHYIDVILQPKYLFRYTASGPEGLVKNRKMVIITSRGGDYAPGSPSRAFDLQEPYLKNVFGFAGVTDITFVNAQPMDMGSELQDAGLKIAEAQAKEAAKKF